MMTTGLEKTKEPANSLLDREQVLLVSGKEMIVFKTGLEKSDFGSFDLSAEVDIASPEAIQISMDPGLVRGQKLTCLHDGVECSAELEMLTSSNLSFSERQTLHFVCGTIEGPPVDGQVYEFLLPHVDFGKGDYFTRVEYENGGFAQVADHILFQWNSVSWSLRRLVEVDGVFYPADEAIRIQRDAGAARPALTLSRHSALQVSCDSIGRSEAENAASDICWLLQLAFAQRVAWAEMRVRSAEVSKFVVHRPHSLPEEPSKIKPLRNWLDGRIKEFLESGFSVFASDPQWWRETLNWFSISVETLGIESSSMIYCMLFDRVSTRVLKDFDFPKQIGEAIEEAVTDVKRREALANQITELVREIEPTWPDEKSLAIVQKIREFNNQPSYPVKIAKAFELVGLNGPPAKLLQQRHRLLHEGKLTLDRDEAFAFFSELYAHVLSLLLAMLGYSGEFFSFGKGRLEMQQFRLSSSEAGDNGDTSEPSKPRETEEPR